MDGVSMVLLIPALVACAFLGWRVRETGRRLKDAEERLKHVEERTQTLQADLAALCRASAGAGDRILRLSNQLRRLSERQDRTELQTMTDRSFERAIQLVQEGGDIEALMNQCGLTRGEAELLVTVHGMNVA